MPDQQPSTGTTTTTTTAPAAGPSDLPPGASGVSTPRFANPIGVPQYTVDPSTGQIAYQPKLDSSGNPVFDASGNPQYETDAQGNAIPLPWIGNKTSPFAKDLFGGYANTNGDTSFFGAQYFDGDEWGVIGNLPPETRAEVQQAMIDRGLFGAKKPNIAFGAWDSDSASAFKQVLAFANSTGQGWQDALQNMPVKETTDGTTVARGNYNINLSSPQDLAAVFKKAAADLIGGSDVPQEDVDKFVRAYQAQEKAYYEAQIAQNEADKRDSAAAAAGTGGAQLDAQGRPIQSPVGGDLGIGALPDSAEMSPTDTTNSPRVLVTNKPADASVAAQDAIKKSNPGRYGATQLAGTFDKFISILGGMSGGSSQGTAA